MCPAVAASYRSAPLNLSSAADGLAETWSPRVAGQINDVLVKVVKILGDFEWHSHPESDEAFLCLTGRLTIDLRDGEREQERTVTIDPGDLYVIRRGVFHCPHSPAGASVALFEAAGIKNTGDADGALTAPVDRPLDA